MFAAITSLLTGTCVRPDVAMTGEITLRGLVLPVGGIKEKMLAAHRAGIKRVILPERNQKDVVDVPEEIRQDMTILCVKNVHDVAEHVFERPVVPADAVPEPPSETGGAPAVSAT
jgi:ATP-dependent Lon protease